MGVIIVPVFQGPETEAEGRIDAKARGRGGGGHGDEGVKGHRPGKHRGTGGVGSGVLGHRAGLQLTCS